MLLLQLLQLLLRALLLPELLELPLVQLELLLHHHLLRARSRVGATLRAPPPATRRDVHLLVLQVPVLLPLGEAREHLVRSAPAVDRRPLLITPAAAVLRRLCRVCTPCVGRLAPGLGPSSPRQRWPRDGERRRRRWRGRRRSQLIEGNVGSEQRVVEAVDDARLELLRAASSRRRVRSQGSEGHGRLLRGTSSPDAHGHRVCHRHGRGDSLPRPGGEQRAQSRLDT